MQGPGIDVTLNNASLEDRFEVDKGRVFITATQALVRLALVQRDRDAAAGLDTAGFISGYRGSPLGGLDLALWREKERLQASHVVFQPGVNEDLAATSVWGTQQFDAFPGPRRDGVFAMWYGKGPGVDRSGDAIRHGNMAGSHRHGGVLLVFGDDHPGKSSTVAHQSEPTLAAHHVPVLYPASVAEFLEFGLMGWALSRYSGCWVGFKTVNETIEQTATVEVDTAACKIRLPDPSDLLPPQGIHIRPWVYAPAEAEVIQVRHRLPLVHRFVRANGLDRRAIGRRGALLGICAAGKSYLDVLEALGLLGIDADRAVDLGVSVYKVGCIWPLEPEGLREFAVGTRELLFVEEKRAFMEPQAAAIFINEDDRPLIVGKLDEKGASLLPSEVLLEPLQIARLIADRLVSLGLADAALSARAGLLAHRQAPAGLARSVAEMRLPYFCSGCPHNTSTKLPEGSVAMGGIGCHGMAVFTRRDTLPPCHMGAEGTNWIGIAPFSSTPHVFQNLGDGTYYHSGLLAIRAAVASGLNITYKVLYNDAVAMTGGQPVDGPLSVADITHQVLHEGVKRCVVVSDAPEKFGPDSGLAAGVEVLHRDQLDQVHRELRDMTGCTVIVYEQTCAAEKRRRRKRGRLPDPPRRLFINEAVCEGCGDCSSQSTCVSIQPVETGFGTRRRIDQSSCNKDYSCNKGFCPSFITVENAVLRKPRRRELDTTVLATLPVPAVAAVVEHSYGVMIAGVGGTGVITVGAVLGMAAHLEGQFASTYDMTGLSQKNGAVFSHLRISPRADRIHSSRLGVGDASLVLAFDLVAALSPEPARTIVPGRTRLVGNSDVLPTAAFQFDARSTVDSGLLQQRIRGMVGDEGAEFVPAAALALDLCGDTIGANLFLVGYASQRGLLPVGIEAIERAIELNGTAVELNRRAFRLGRLYAHDPALMAVGTTGSPGRAPDLPRTLEEVVEHRAAHLRAYQDDALAMRYRQWVDRVAAAERRASPGSDELARTVARAYAGLLAYKDEYEVARLHVDPALQQRLEETFEPGYRLRFNLAPPLLSRTDPRTGRAAKREFGRWMIPVFRMLASLKGLRGTALDPFGRTEERRMERQLIADYEALMTRILPALTAARLPLAVELAALPETVRGFGHVKLRNVEAMKARREELLARFDGAGEAAAEAIRTG
jgi:indolepyruvate ferredoxin oxidoreductase